MHSMSPSPWRETMAKNRVIHKNGVSPTINMEPKCRDWRQTPPIFAGCTPQDLTRAPRLAAALKHVTCCSRSSDGATPRSRQGRMTSSSNDHGVAASAGDGADCSTDRQHRQRAIGFLNGAHALDHFVILIYPTVVIELATVYGRSYSELIALGTASFTAFGLFSLPAGWLADRWSRRNMMVAFYLGSGLSLVAAAFSPSLTVLAAALFALGVFGAIYHPVGTALLLENATERGRTLAFNAVCGNLGVALAAGITAALTATLSWRAALFSCPASSVSQAAGPISGLLAATPAGRLRAPVSRGRHVAPAGGDDFCAVCGGRPDRWSRGQYHRHGIAEDR